ncbi:MAG: hypothetical protein PWP08_1014 [Methanofollis sp.]|nr:hypothetical protein [Methanofollis sp.]
MPHDGGPLSTVFQGRGSVEGGPQGEGEVSDPCVSIIEYPGKVGDLEEVAVAEERLIRHEEGMCHG